MSKSQKKESVIGNMMKVLVPLTLLSVAGINIVLFLMIRQSNKALLNQAMDEVVSDNVALLSEQIHGVIIQLETLADFRTGQHFSDSVSFEMMRILVEKSDGLFRFGGFTNPDGTTITTRTDSGHVWRASEELINYIAMNKYLVSDRHQSSDGKRDVFYVHLPTVDNGKMTSIITVAVDAQKVSDMMCSLMVMGDGSSMVVNSRTTLVQMSENHPEWVNSFKLTDSSDYQGLNVIGDAIVAGEDYTVPMDIVAPNGEQYALIWKKIEYTDWHYVFAMPVSALKDRNKLLINLFALFLPASVVFFVVLLVLLINSHINRPLKSMLSAVKCFETGHLYKVQDLKPERNDELGQTVKAIAEMSQKLESITQNIRTKSSQIVADSQTLSNSAEHICQSVSRQATSVDEISAVLGYMLDIVSHNTVVAVETQQLIKGLAEDINLVSEVSKKSLASTLQITDKIRVINDIASKTDLLAINAAVEATKATDEGKGFAVVATEIKKLAERCRAAVIQIDEATSEDVRFTQSVAQVFDKLVPVSENTNGKISSIAASAKDLELSSQQISQSIKQLAEIATKNAISAEDMLDKAESFSKYASGLVKDVNFFKTKDSDLTASIRQKLEQHTAELKRIQFLYDMQKPDNQDS